MPYRHLRTLENRLARLEKQLTLDQYQKAIEEERRNHGKEEVEGAAAPELVTWEYLDELDPMEWFNLSDSQQYAIRLFIQAHPPISKKPRRSSSRKRT